MKVQGSRSDSSRRSASINVGSGPAVFTALSFVATTQVPHTFAYFEETYGVINEKQVGIAESTCSGIFGAKPATQGGYALMSVDTLSQLAMERATTAREAVQLMGAMAEKYGFYGAG